MQPLCCKIDFCHISAIFPSIFPIFFPSSDKLRQLYIVGVHPHNSSRTLELQRTSGGPRHTAQVGGLGSRALPRPPAEAARTPPPEGHKTQAASAGSQHPPMSFNSHTYKHCVKTLSLPANLIAHRCPKLARILLRGEAAEWITTPRRWKRR